MKNKILCILLCFCILTAIFPHSSFASEEPERHGATTISGNEKYVYDKLAEGITKDEPAECIEFDETKNITEEELNRAYTMFVSDYPECFWVSKASGYSYSYFSNGATKRIVAVSPSYSFKGESLKTAKKALNDAVSAILSGMPKGDTYTKALYLHDALAKKVTYKSAGEHQTAYGALVAGEAVCAGYAAAYQLLLQKAGIKAWTVAGWSLDPSEVQVAHAWNVVWMDASTCVYTDVTWDDQGDTLYHYYFNISKHEIEEGHVVNSNFYTLPACNHENESYFDKNSCTVTANSTPAEVAALFGGAIDSTKRKAIIYYDGSGHFYDWLEENFTDLYFALGGGYGSFGWSTNYMGKEFHITVSGNFSAPITPTQTTTKPTTVTTVTTKPTTVTTVTTTKPTTVTTVTTTKPTTVTTVTTTKPTTVTTVTTTKPTTVTTVTTTKPTTVTTVTTTKPTTATTVTTTKPTTVTTVTTTKPTTVTTVTTTKPTTVTTVTTTKPTTVTTVTTTKPTTVTTVTTTKPTTVTTVTTTKP
ncbi:MAG: hypothetical protein IJ021_05450, partial [Clostridia bacterium]|nr:hypothetical protein [Clostridia bacterium]